jgi:hypothetical protein
MRDFQSWPRLAHGGDVNTDILVLWEEMTIKLGFQALQNLALGGVLTIKV